MFFPKLLGKALPKQAFGKSFTKTSFWEKLVLVKACFGKAFPKSFLDLTPFIMVKW